MILGDVCLNYNNMLFNVADYAKKVTYFDQKQTNLTYLMNLVFFYKQVSCLGCGILTAVHASVVSR